MQVTLFTPFPKQKEFLDGFIESDKMFGVVVSPRGAGKTLMAMNLLLYWVLHKPKSKSAWVSPVYSQARNVFDQIVQAAGELVESSNRMEMIINLINGSSIKLLSADSPDSIRGFRFNYVIIDEAAFVKDLTIDQAILPTLNPNGRKCLLISTPKSKNHFYSWFMKEDVYSMRFKLSDCPYINQEVIDTAKASLPPDIFRQEYEAEFVDSSNDVFVGVNKVSILGAYETPKGQDAYVGIDTGLTDDMSVLTLLSPIGKVLGIHWYNKDSLQSIATKFINTMNGYNIVGGYIETNGIGRGMYDLIKPKFRKVKELNTNQANKTEMVRKLINDIETTTIELPSEELCPQLHSEFSTYTYKLSNTGKLSFSHIAGAHDDFVDSLLMANYSRNQFMTRKPITIKGSRTKNLRPTFGSIR